jgi:hypothetical protein
VTSRAGAVDVYQLRPLGPPVLVAAWSAAAAAANASQPGHARPEAAAANAQPNDRPLAAAAAAEAAEAAVVAAVADAADAAGDPARTAAANHAAAAPFASPAAAATTAGAGAASPSGADEEAFLQRAVRAVSDGELPPGDDGNGDDDGGGNGNGNGNDDGIGDGDKDGNDDGIGDGDKDGNDDGNDDGNGNTVDSDVGAPSLGQFPPSLPRREQGPLWPVPGFGRPARCAPAVEGLVLNARGTIALLLLGPRRPRPTSGPGDRYSRFRSIL